MLVILFLGFLGGIVKGAVSVVKSVTGLGSSSDVASSKATLDYISNLTNQANQTAAALKAQNDALALQLQNQQQAAALAKQKADEAAQAALAAQQGSGQASGMPPWLLPVAIGAGALFLLRQR